MPKKKKEKKYTVHFSTYTPIEEALPESGRFVMTQIDYGNRTTIVICKVSEDGTFLWGKPLKPLTGVHITGWKYINNER